MWRRGGGREDNQSLTPNLGLTLKRNRSKRTDVRLGEEGENAKEITLVGTVYRIE